MKNEFQMSKPIKRRKFFRDTAFSSAGLILGSNLLDLSPEEHPTSASFNIMKEVMKYRKIDAHEHVTLDGSNIDANIDIADRLGAFDFASISFLERTYPHRGCVRCFFCRIIGAQSLSFLFSDQSLSEFFSSRP